MIKIFEVKKSSIQLPSIQLLEALISIAESSSLAEAAKTLGLTQPALSMQLKRLEEIFEYPIFEFHGKRKLLTFYGTTVYKESKRLLAEFNESFEIINRMYLDSKKQVLRVGGRRELIFKAQKTIDFEGSVIFSIMSSEEAIVELHKKNIDIAISRIKPNSSDLIAKEFFSNCSWLVTHEKWISNESTKRLIQNKHFFMNTPALAYGSSAILLNEWIQQIGLQLKQLNIKYVCEDWLTILQMVESGEGYAIMPDSIESNLKTVQHFELPCNLVTTQTYYFLYHKNLKKFPAYKTLFKGD